MYDDVMLSLIFVTLVWIAVGLQIIASSILSLGKLIRYPTRKAIAHLERNKMPWIAKMVVVKVLSHFAIRYVNKKLR